MLIAGGSIELCFLINAASYAGMFLALRSLDTEALAPPKLAAREPGAIRIAFRYATRTPELAIPLAMMALVGTLSLNFMVLLPLLARQTFDGGAASYSALVISMGVGAVIGAVVMGTRERIGERHLIGSAIAFGVFELIAATAPTLKLEALALVPLGAASVTFAAGVNSTIQLAADPSMRGRVMALYMIVFMGSTPIGGPITGLLSGVFGARAALVMGGTAGLLAGLGAALAFARFRESAVSSGQAVVVAAWPEAPDPDRGLECERAGSADGRERPRRRTERRPGPRSPAPQPHAGATRAR